MMIPSSILVPVGLIWYGWSAQKNLHWIMPNSGFGVFGCGIIIGMQCIQAYLVDAYSHYAASAVGSTVVLKGVVWLWLVLPSGTKIFDGLRPQEPN